MLKRERITLEQASLALSYYLSLPIRFVEIELEESLKIARKLNIYAYDAYLIRCAEKYRSPLLTLDQSLRFHAKYYGIETIEVSP
jgi:predicted nucleic acid-binding protein